MGQGTHVSLFFVVMMSEYDDMLEWPFRKYVTFSIISPHTGQEVNVEKMQPNPNSSSFQKPRKHMNIASGCPLFISREKLQQFIINDSFFLKIKVE